MSHKNMLKKDVTTQDHNNLVYERVINKTISGLIDTNYRENNEFRDNSKTYANELMKSTTDYLNASKKASETKPSILMNTANPIIDGIVSTTTNPLIDRTGLTVSEAISSASIQPTDATDTTTNLSLISDISATDEVILSIKNPLIDDRTYSQNQSLLFTTLPSLSYDSTPTTSYQIKGLQIPNILHAIGSNYMIFITAWVVAVCVIVLIIFLFKYMKLKKERHSYDLVSTSEPGKQTFAICT